MSEKSISDYIIPGAGKLPRIPKDTSLNRWKLGRVLLVTILAALVGYHLLRPFAFLLLETPAGTCPQSEPLYPFKSRKLWESLNSLYDNASFQAKAAEWLGDSVRIPTETFDDMGLVGEDERWDTTRAPFVDFLATGFPLVHATLEKSTVNTYGLIYEWKGSDLTLKPILLMAHYDVVPVNPETIDQWTHPPYSGYFDGERIWGRGSSDDKSGIIGILITLETLIEKGWTPRRGIVLSFGFDEESGGYHGAKYLAPAIEAKFGPKSMALIVDEGSGYLLNYGTTMAVVGVGEKGSADMIINVRSPGGHSSVPPESTTIGLLAQSIVDIEKNPPSVHLTPGQPTHEMALCMGAHSPDIPNRVRKAIALSSTRKSARKFAEKWLFKSHSFKMLTATTQAVDIINGGVKSNALPELATTLVNHRIATESTVAATKARDANLLKEVAHKLRLNFTAYGEDLSHPHHCHKAIGSMELLTRRVGLEPAPLTPTSGKPYQLFAGSVRAAYATHRNDTTQPLVISPGIMSGNTDTKYFWNISNHIVRYNHHDLGSAFGLGSGVHTVNEYLALSNFIEQIRFFSAVILNADEAELE